MLPPAQWHYRAYQDFLKFAMDPMEFERTFELEAKLCIANLGMEASPYLEVPRWFGSRSAWACSVVFWCLRIAAISVHELVRNSTWVNKVSVAKAAGQLLEQSSGLAPYSIRGDNQPLAYWAARAPHDLLELLEKDKRQPITQFKLYAVVAAKATWQHLARSKTMWFIDKLGAKTVFTKGCSRDLLLRRILKSSRAAAIASKEAEPPERRAASVGTDLGLIRGALRVYSTQK
eukprot:4144340-Amphidinium_carterae.2